MFINIYKCSDTFNLEGLLLSAKLPVNEKEQLVKKYAELFVSNGFSDKVQLSLINQELLVSFGIPRMHTAAILEAVQKYEKGNSSTMTRKYHSRRF